MKVFKFGGASVSSAQAVRNLAEILRSAGEPELVVVVSAMGKTTNALERIAAAWYAQENWESAFRELAGYHTGIANELLSAAGMQVLSAEIDTLGTMLSRIPPLEFGEAYDRIVSHGEILSTLIVSRHLAEQGIACQWHDARKLIITDNLFREANIDWETTTRHIREAIRTEQKREQVSITQGFIGSTMNGIPTTLGREGSDFTAAIFASALDAEEVVIWKDVRGLLNADPKHFGETCLLEAISYREAIELAYYGATIIHPKTIKPLQNKGIPLYVKPFTDPGSAGSVIRAGEEQDHLHPSYIFKWDQVLLTLSPRDFSFMDERMLAVVFQAFAYEHLKINLMQNSAISLSLCFDHREDKFGRITERLKNDFRYRYNTGLELITIRHYTEDAISKVTSDKDILLEQRSRITAQFVAKPHE